MAKTTTFELNPKIRPALRKHSKETGLSMDKIVNNALLALLKDYIDNPDMTIADDRIAIHPEFFPWCETNLVIDTRLSTPGLYTSWINEYTAPFNKKLFIIWIRQFCIKNGYIFSMGKNLTTRWIMLQ